VATENALCAAISNPVRILDPVGEAATRGPDEPGGLRGPEPGQPRLDALRSE